MYILIKRHLFYSTFTWTFQFFFQLFIFNFFVAGRAQKTWATDWRKTRAKPKYHYQKNSTIMYACVCVYYLYLYVCNYIIVYYEMSCTAARIESKWTMFYLLFGFGLFSFRGTQINNKTHKKNT